MCDSCPQNVTGLIISCPPESLGLSSADVHKKKSTGTVPGKRQAYRIVGYSQSARFELA